MSNLIITQEIVDFFQRVINYCYKNPAGENKCLECIDTKEIYNFFHFIDFCSLHQSDIDRMEAFLESNKLAADKLDNKEPECKEAWIECESVEPGIFSDELVVTLKLFNGQEESFLVPRQKVNKNLLRVIAQIKEPISWVTVPMEQPSLIPVNMNCIRKE